MSGAADASFPALGTIASIAVDDASLLEPARAAVEAEIAAIDRACSRFRADSDLVRVNAACGTRVRVSRECIEAIEVALAAAELTDGRVDPTVGRAMRVLGYDRDFAAMALDGPPLTVSVASVPGWQCVDIDHASATVRVPVGVELDLGATAKALCADRAAHAAHAQTGARVVVGLGGDIAIAGGAPDRGWLVQVVDDPADSSPSQLIALGSGGLATSGTTRRRWTRGDVELHHLVDPGTVRPVQGPWRAVTVAAASCVEANVATTASIVMGEAAVAWLDESGLPARLVTHAGDVVTVAGWPAPEPELVGCPA